MAANAAAAEPMADEAQPAPDSGKGWLIGLVVTTLLAAAAGASMGFLLGPKMAGASQQQEVRSNEQEKEDIRPLYKGDHVILRLQPITTNLGAPSHSWVRLEGALVVKAEEMDEKAREELALRVQQDVLAYLRTLSLRDLEGASNLAFLHDDLHERARVRSEGRVEEFIILSLVVE